MAKVECLQIHATECPHCGSDLLIRDAIQIGERIRCNVCNAYSTIGSITAKHHDGKKIHHTIEVETSGAM